MKHPHGLAVVALLIIGLNVSTGQPVLAIGSLDSQVYEPSPVSFPDTFASEISCSDTFKEQEIPDDGSWLQVCLLDPIAPDQGIVTEVNVKYTLDHPDPGQLEVHLSRENGEVSQTLWDGDNLEKDTKLGQVIDLDGFNGSPAQGGWVFMVRDVVPGHVGWLRGLTVRPSYASTGPMPVQLSGTPGRPTFFRFPPGTVEYIAPDSDEIESEIEGPDALLELTGSWQTIKSEPFEISFPTAGWTRSDAYPNDNKEYLWDDDNSRAHTGYRAAWPAKGGANGLNPPDDPYPPYAMSWMKYGPFDLSDASTAEASFWLWREIESGYDFIWFGISHDLNGEYSGWDWSGTADWEEMRFNLDGFYNDSSVYVGWLFQSDYAVQYEGPWVDDAVIQKYVAGQVTPQGTFSYFDRLNNSVGARFVKVYLYDEDLGGTDDLLATTTTDANGYFQFTTRTNWDDDDSDPDPDNRRLDLYVVWEADYEDNGSTHHNVTNFGGQTYKWYRSPYTDAPDGSIDLGGSIAINSGTRPAMWVFQDLRRAWEYVRNHTSPQFDPGSVMAKWEDGQECYLMGQWICSSFFYGTDIGGPFIFIKDQRSNSADEVVHETGHNYMYNATGWWWWNPGCWDHQMFTQEDANCAWSEGWGDYSALIANGDQCYDLGVGPCTGTYYNLETQGWGDGHPAGDNIEGRVAGAFYDLFDTVNEGYDSAAVGFDPIADIVFQGTVEHSFSEFWNSWKTSGQNKHHAVQAIYQNTIDYDTPPRFSPLLPDRYVLQNHLITHAIDLWAYSTDDESSDAELTYQITNLTDTRCGISLVDVHWINIVPQTGWLGMCDATVRVSDSLNKTASDTFRVTVVPVAATINLPIIMK